VSFRWHSTGCSECKVVAGGSRSVSTVDGLHCDNEIVDGYRILKIFFTNLVNFKNSQVLKMSMVDPDVLNTISSKLLSVLYSQSICPARLLQVTLVINLWPSVGHYLLAMPSRQFILSGDGVDNFLCHLWNDWTQTRECYRPDRQANLHTVVWCLWILITKLRYFEI